MGNYLLPNTTDGIVLSLDENAIHCTLSRYLPTYINKNIEAAITAFLQKNKLRMKDIGIWAVHPGGKRIIENVQQGLMLKESDVNHSWEILDKYGNMLSSSIMFVLEKIKNTDTNTNTTYCVAMSFSPGVGVECLLLRVKPPK
jgi:alpha-pyrone synthase